MKRVLLVFLLGLVFASCATGPAPIEEFTLARAAIEAAKSVEAARLSPDYWHQAEDFYQIAQRLYDEREFEKSRIEFIRSRIAAEKAETASRLLRQKNGEVL
jgi:PBP1b-binding outer membrane lipoprotein LpoB